MTKEVAQQDHRARRASPVCHPDRACVAQIPLPGPGREGRTP